MYAFNSLMVVWEISELHVIYKERLPGSMHSSGSLFCSVMNLILQNPAVGCDRDDLPGYDLAAVFESGFHRAFQTTAAGNFHPDKGQGFK